MSPPAASALFLIPGLLFLLLAVTAASSTAGDTNTTVSAISGNSSALSTPTTADNGDPPPEQYVCYLCGGRDPILMRWCPVYWDECHLVCYTPEVTATNVTNATATAALAGRALSAAGEVDHDGCYVMKLYSDGRYVIVTRISCSATDSCLLSCGGGDVATDGTAPLVNRGLPRPRADEFGPRCGTQLQ